MPQSQVWFQPWKRTIHPHYSWTLKGHPGCNTKKLLCSAGLSYVLKKLVACCWDKAARLAICPGTKLAACLWRHTSLDSTYTASETLFFRTSFMGNLMMLTSLFPTVQKINQDISISILAIMVTSFLGTAWVKQMKRRKSWIMGVPTGQSKRYLWGFTHLVNRMCEWQI